MREEKKENKYVVKRDIYIRKEEPTHACSGLFYFFCLIMMHKYLEQTGKKRGQE
jgi:hypothetical protein